MTKDEVKAAVLALPEGERRELLDEIHFSELHANFQPDPGFDAEIDRRMAEIKAGEVEMVDADAVLNRIREKHGLPAL
jgi:hypothetical protein